MSFEGSWNTTMNTPMGAQQGSVEFSVDGSALTGKMSASGNETEIKDGKVDGNTAEWKADITQPMPLTLEFSATLDGDSIEGTVKLGAFGNATFTGSRA